MLIIFIETCSSGTLIHITRGGRLRQFSRQREAEKLSLVALSLIMRKLSRCRCREEKLTAFMCCAVGGVWWWWVVCGGRKNCRVPSSAITR